MVPSSIAVTNRPRRPELCARPLIKVGLGAAGLLILAALVWQWIAYAGAPDPSSRGLSPAAMAFSSAILVFREGLEAILVLATVTAGIVRSRRDQWQAVGIGAAAALIATVATWFIVVAVMSAISAPALAIQAATGLLAIVVLLVVMNWFFHKIYWTGWISHHGKRRRKLVLDGVTAKRAFIGFALLGFTAIYREGFEIVLFLQDLRLKAGTGVVLAGAGVGLLLTAATAVLTFALHQRLPYKRMLVLTGVMLAVVLIVMVGESAQEMQLAGWLTTHPIHLAMPAWIGTWLAIFPNWEGLIAQIVAIAVVAGSYSFVRFRVRHAT
jgi:high-affinity iron transporter